MGFLDFVKGAGEKIFGKDKEEAAATAQAEQAATQANYFKTKALFRAVDALGLPLEGLDIHLDGDAATVKGKVSRQADAEKIVLVIGNTMGIARVDNQIEVEEPEPVAQYHTVASGESLGKIAQRYYGKASLYTVIFEANKPMLKDPDKIYPGQVLRIPPHQA